MNLSPLQLERYWLTELHLSVIPDFDQQKQLGLKDEHFTIEWNGQPTAADGRGWQISLNLKQSDSPGTNIPYKIGLRIVGLFRVHSVVPEDQVEQLVRTNGSSMLFGAAREIVRDLTVRGPYPGLMLPSVSFYPDAKPAAPPPKP